MLFHEVYGVYYQTLARILALAQQERLTKQELYRIVREAGFEESILTIPQLLEDQTWPLLNPDLTTPLEEIPTMPLTLLQKRWLKALLCDPRIRLFDPSEEGLEDTEPLYPSDALVFFDRYGDGDPYQDPGYIRRFRIILTGLREKRRLRIQYTGAVGVAHSRQYIPRRLEYSAKDDKFRLLCGDGSGCTTINLGRITHCQLLEPWGAEVREAPSIPQKELQLELRDQRNALERCMLHFSHLRKETQRMGEDRYLVKLFYEPSDETELLIRVLSFGPMVKVISPEDFRQRLIQRLRRQRKLGAGPEETQ